MSKSFVAIAALAAGLAGPAGAVSFTTSAGGTPAAATDPGYGSQTLIYDFDTVSPAAGALQGDYRIQQAPGITNVTAAPAGTAARTNFLTVPFNSIPGSATLDLGGSFSDVSFYWGSIDNYNTLTVYGAGGIGDVIATITGAQVGPPANGGQQQQATNRRIFLTADAGEVITGFGFASTQYAFETDSFAGTAVVPEPATWGMMLLGFGLVGGAARARRRATVAA